MAFFTVGAGVSDAQPTPLLYSSHSHCMAEGALRDVVLLLALDEGS